MKESSNQSPPIGERSVYGLVGIDQQDQQPSIAEDLVSEITDVNSKKLPSECSVKRAPYRVANWLVGDGEE